MRRRWFDLRNILCTRGLHWPIRWSEAARAGSSDPPHAPEPGYACDWCGDERLPYRSWWWDLKHRYYEWRYA